MVTIMMMLRVDYHKSTIAVTAISTYGLGAALFSRKMAYNLNYIDIYRLLVC